MSETAGMLPWAKDGVDYTQKVTTATDPNSGRRMRQTWRQIGWVGQSGTPYPLGDLSVVHAGEPGGYAPLWLLAHADEDPFVEERAMEAARRTKEFRVGSRFEVPTDAVESFTAAVVRAALEATS